MLVIMKPRHILAILLLSALPGLASSAAAEELRLMTFNIRYDTSKDGKSQWSNRKEHVRDCITAQKPDVVGLQEALDHQLNFLQKELPDFDSVGHGRDGGDKGEYSAIIYRKDRLTVLESGTFWLSDTPGKRSLSWTASLPRICTWARFEVKASGKRLYIFNTHWDHRSQLARVNSAALIVERIAKRRHTDPVVVMGDLNATPDNPAITTLLADETGLRDSFAEGTTPSGTISGFKGNPNGRRIDYVMVDKRLKAEPAQIIRSERDGRYPSDHFPVLTVVDLR
jgi:endonuclease/exonuclease/phosphatase family metal-dependent hydrolase